MNHLGALRPGESGVIQEIRARFEGDRVSQRLLQIGMTPGTLVTVEQEGPSGGDPIAVRVRGALFAVRREEASCVVLS